MEKNRSYINYNVRQVFEPATFDEDKRTVEGILTTEQPVLMWDWARWEPIMEILLVDGMIEKSKVPLLDAHNRYQADNVLGSSYDFRLSTDPVSGLKVITCTNEISSKEDKILTKIREGHLDSTSVGYKVFTEHSITIEPGQEVDIDGRTFKNEYDLNLVIRKQWEIMENSIVPIGADDKAKMRSAYIQNEAPENEIKTEATQKDAHAKMSEPSQADEYRFKFLKLKFNK
jgi:phage head maturation protease